MDSLFSNIRKLLRNRLDKKYEKKISIAFSSPATSSPKLIIRITSDDLNRSYRVPDSYDKLLKSYLTNETRRKQGTSSLRLQSHTKRYKYVSKHNYY